MASSRISSAAGARSAPPSARPAWTPAQRRARTRWLRQDGVAFIRGLGVAEGDAVLDFGCGSGAYSLPAARAVGAQGLIVAVDRQPQALALVKRAARRAGLNAVQTARDLPGAAAQLDGRRCAAVLLYDVLHHLTRPDRARLYGAVRALLRPHGLLSVHPKHLAGAHASLHFRGVTLAGLVREIEAAGFRLRARRPAALWHNRGVEDGVVLNFGRHATPRAPTAGHPSMKTPRGFPS